MPTARRSPWLVEIRVRLALAALIASPNPATYSPGVGRAFACRDPHGCSQTRELVGGRPLYLGDSPPYDPAGDVEHDVALRSPAIDRLDRDSTAFTASK